MTSKLEVTVGGREVPMAHATEIISDLADWAEFCGTRHPVTGVRAILNLDKDSDFDSLHRLVDAAKRALTEKTTKSPREDSRQ